MFNGASFDTTLSNVTFSGNRSVRWGGALYQDFLVSGYSVQLHHVTFSGNRAGVDGAAIYVSNDGGLSVAGSLVAKSSTVRACGGTPIVDEGANLADDPTCFAGDTITGLDPVLADNGGPTLTHALRANSNAIDTAGDCGLLTDQRGFGRAGACDSGAYEFDAAPPVGGSTNGLAVSSVRCTNATTGDSVSIVEASWNCRIAGLGIDSGDRVRQQADGKPLARAVGGTSLGIDEGRVSCRNLISGQEVAFDLEGETSWDCRERGLEFDSNDSLRWTLVGVAE